MGVCSNGRWANDFAALVMHVAATATIIGVWFHKKTVRKPAALTCFMTQELIAVVAHLYYLVCYRFKAAKKDRGWWNSTKWIEYGFSATAGTLGTFFAGVEPGSATTNEYISVIIILCLGFSQQRIGYALDIPPKNGAFLDRTGVKKFLFFTLAFVFQVIENALVIVQSPPNFITPIYVVMWSLFGFHCGFRLRAVYTPQVSQFHEPWKDDYWTELVYSYLGWTAKISVLLVALPDAFVELSASETNAMYGVMAFLFVFTFGGLVVIKAAFQPSGDSALKDQLTTPNDMLFMTPTVAVSGT